MELPADLPEQVVVELPEADLDLCTRHWVEPGEELLEVELEDTVRTDQAGTGRGREEGDLQTVRLLEEEEWSSLEGRERSRQETEPRRSLGWR